MAQQAAVRVPDRVRQPAAGAPGLDRRASASVVIAAYDEQAGIGACLAHLLEGVDDGELEVVVVPNGCHDDTAGVAGAFPVRVSEIAQASKPAALREGDRVATAFPRLYLDADVLLSPSAARAVIAELEKPGALAARPRVHYDTRGASPLVRSYYRARRELPSVHTSLWGAGVYALSAQGRARFGPFPDVTADDLFVQQQFEPGEVVLVGGDPVVVRTPRTVSGLLQVLRRQARGTQALAGAPGATTTRATLRDLLRLASRGPRPALDALVYAGLAACSRVRPAGAPVRWERDTSSREG